MIRLRYMALWLMAALLLSAGCATTGRVEVTSPETTTPPGRTEREGGSYSPAVVTVFDENGALLSRGLALEAGADRVLFPAAAVPPGAFSASVTFSGNTLAVENYFTLPGEHRLLLLKTDGPHGIPPVRRSPEGLERALPYRDGGAESLPIQPGTPLLDTQGRVAGIAFPRPEITAGYIAVPLPKSANGKAPGALETAGLPEFRPADNGLSEDGTALVYVAAPLWQKGAGALSDELAAALVERGGASKAAARHAAELLRADHAAQACQLYAGREPLSGRFADLARDYQRLGGYRQAADLYSAAGGWDAIRLSEEERQALFEEYSDAYIPFRADYAEDQRETLREIGPEEFLPEAPGFREALGFLALNGEGEEALVQKALELAAASPKWKPWIGEHVGLEPYRALRNYLPEFARNNFTAISAIPGVSLKSGQRVVLEGDYRVLKVLPEAFLDGEGHVSAFGLVLRRDGTLMLGSLTGWPLQRYHDAPSIRGEGAVRLLSDYKAYRFPVLMEILAMDQEGAELSEPLYSQMPNNLMRIIRIESLKYSPSGRINIRCRFLMGDYYSNNGVQGQGDWVLSTRGGKIEELSFKPIWTSPW